MARPRPLALLAVLACAALPAAAAAVPISGVQVNVVSLLRVDVEGFVKPAPAANVCGVNLFVILRNARGAVIYEGTREIHTLLQAEYALGYRQDKPLRCPQPPAAGFAEEREPALAAD